MELCVSTGLSNTLDFNELIEHVVEFENKASKFIIRCTSLYVLNIQWAWCLNMLLETVTLIVSQGSVVKW